MAQRRMIAKNISTSEKFADLKHDRSRLLYLMTIPHTDDYGRFDASPRTFKAIVCPLLGYSIDEVRESLEEMVEVGLIHLYTVNGHQYGLIVGFERFQKFRSDRKREALYPPPDTHWDTNDTHWDTNDTHWDTNDTHWDTNDTHDFSPDTLSKDNLREVNLREEQLKGVAPQEHHNVIESEKQSHPDVTVPDPPQGRMTPVFAAWQEALGMLGSLQAQRLTRLADWVEEQVAKNGLQDAGYLSGPEMVLEGIKELIKRKPPPAKPLRYLEAMVTRTLEEEIAKDLEGKDASKEPRADGQGDCSGPRAV